MDKSWGQGHLPHSPWSWMERCRLPWSRHRLPSGRLECGCNIKHQLTLETSYLVMGTHANSTHVQAWATCMCLPKRKAKEHGHCQKSCQGFGQLFGKGTLFGRPIFKQTLRNYQPPCVHPQTTPEQYKECVNQKNTVYLNSCPILYPAASEEHPMNSNDPDRVLFWKTCTGKKCINFYTLDLG